MTTAAGFREVADEMDNTARTDEADDMPECAEFGHRAAAALTEDKCRTEVGP